MDGSFITIGMRSWDERFVGIACFASSRCLDGMEISLYTMRERGFLQKVDERCVNLADFKAGCVEWRRGWRVAVGAGRSVSVGFLEVERLTILELSARIGSVDVDMDARDGTSQHLAVFIDIGKDPPTICALPAPVTQVPAPPNHHAPCIALLVQRQRIHDELLATLFASSTTLRELEETEETAESLKVKS
nr:hypothetical protein L204_00560 [Cryptococcus depauperatus CBS 7855]